MKRKVKRKYTRKAAPGALESPTSPAKEESGTIPQGEVVKAFSFDDLPLSIKMQVESAIKYRKAKGLPDDSRERKDNAIKYFRGDRPR